MGYYEKGLAEFETNDTPALAVVDPYPAVGIEIERRSVRQSYRGLLTDRCLKASLFLLLVQIPGSADNHRHDTGSHGRNRPTSARRRRVRGRVHHLAEIDCPNQGTGFHEFLPRG